MWNAKVRGLSGPSFLICSVRLGFMATTASQSFQACRTPFNQVFELQGATFPSRTASALLGSPRIKQSLRIKSSINYQPAETADDSLSRRQVLVAIGTALVTLSNEAVFAAEKVPKDFKVYVDKPDNYAFFYPFGWQEVYVRGQDVVYKDVIEPLESAGTSILPTKKADVHEFGPPNQLAKKLVEDVFTAPSQQGEVIEASERELDGQPYYIMEFVIKSPTYTRHGLASVTVSKGKFYALVTGANERRWNSMQNKLRTVVNSFRLLDV